MDWAHSFRKPGKIMMILSDWISDTSQRLSSYSSSYSKKKQVVQIVLKWRFLYWCFMALSCHFIPDHNPGNDVLRFDLRLYYDDDASPCFCNDHQNNFIIAKKKDYYDYDCPLPTRTKTTAEKNKNCISITDQTTTMVLPLWFWEFWFLHLAAYPGAL